MSYRAKPVHTAVLSSAILLAASSITLAQPEISWRPVHADNKLICLPGEGDCGPNEIILGGGGVRVTLFIRLEDWDPDDDGIPTLGVYQATVDATTYEGGLLPDVAYTAHPGNPGTLTGCDLATLSSDGEYPSCDGAFPALKICCSHLADPIGTADWLSYCGSDPSVCGDFPAGCIDRPDFVFGGLHFTPSDMLNPPDCAIGFATTDCRDDDDQLPYYYGGTLIVEVPACARGTYNVGFVDDDECTYFRSCPAPGELIPGLLRTPAQITIAYSDCNSNGVSDWDDVSSGISLDCDNNGRPDECQVDSDGDGFIDPCDICAGFNDNEDADSDGTPDGCDECPLDPEKTFPGQCGCGTAETGDTDNDGVLDCFDGCANDPNKLEPGICGCGSPDIGDADGDGKLDCIDRCPSLDDAIFGPCEAQDIPTVSSWGMIIFALLLLVVAKVSFLKAQPAAT
ncbi:MAG: hypothetical protein JSU63_12590 [Phycisphaerales bacterium]|nr:MAG: hypothetical protein JSU63_12590 [Phycisphaerales bacterium]